MAAKIATYAGKKILSKEFEKYGSKKAGGDYDPLFEMRPNARGKMKKCKKLIPDYIPEKDAIVLAKVRRRAYRLDMALFSFAGVRFGWESVIGLIPAVGDAAGAIMALMLIRTASGVEGGLPNNVKMQMLMWLVIDFFVGLVPFVGDLLDAGLKCNAKNCRILEEHLDAKYKPDSVKNAEKEEKRKSGANYKAPAPATVYEDFEDERAERDEEIRNGHQRPVQMSEPARTHTGAGRGRREPDLEMGVGPDERVATATKDKRRR